MMKSIVYVSQASAEFLSKGLSALSLHAQLNNQKHGITGFLYFQDTIFFQYIEGDESSIDELYSSIESDARHRIFCDLIIEDIDRKLFFTWDMEWIKQSDLSHIDIESHLIDTLLSGPTPNYSTEKWSEDIKCFIQRVAEKQNELITLNQT
ncbi:BLUF domain-containing protein [Vibrio sp.]|nr:BLUF domain-containing protein [Vibrio sp.]